MVDDEPTTDGRKRSHGSEPITLPESLLSQYVRFSLYNSPFPAHDSGCAVDCYPGTLEGGRTLSAPSPVSGTVREIRTVRAPSKPYAVPDDHLILIDCDGPAPLEGLVARILHVEPTVSAGDRVSPGDSLGQLVRAGFFAPWVDNHLHVGFRSPAQNLHRASGSVALSVGIDLQALEWDGTGTVLATGETYALLDTPQAPDSETAFGGIGLECGGERGILDGGVPHYDGGGILSPTATGSYAGPVRLNGDRLGIVGADGRTLEWDELTVTVDGDPITGLSTFCARGEGVGAKLICPNHELAVGDRVRVSIHTVADD